MNEIEKFLKEQNLPSDIENAIAKEFITRFFIDNPEEFSKISQRVFNQQTQKIKDLEQKQKQTHVALMPVISMCMFGDQTSTNVSSFRGLLGDRKTEDRVDENMEKVFQHLTVDKNIVLKLREDGGLEVPDSLREEIEE
tara:strand:- start:11114 stop:11530 length:417 start_codon:yes stop_codon:yes gene_type:complete